MHEKVLVVEDDPDIMRILLHTLKAAGYQAIAAYGAEDALCKVKLQKFDLILTDLAMPKVSGVEVIQEVKAPTS
jgi:DNA-binding response OmpR family regulator